jgi:hypothetical protein
MTKKEFFEENYLNLLNQAKEELATMVIEVINTQEDETSIQFMEFGIGCAIYKEDVHGADDMHEIISGAWVSADGKVGFTIDTFDSGYEIDMNDLDMDMVLYLIGEFEEINLEV